MYDEYEGVYMILNIQFDDDRDDDDDECVSVSISVSISISISESVHQQQQEQHASHACHVTARQHYVMCDVRCGLQAR